MPLLSSSPTEPTVSAAASRLQRLSAAGRPEPAEPRERASVADTPDAHAVGRQRGGPGSPGDVHPELDPSAGTSLVERAALPSPRVRLGLGRAGGLALIGAVVVLAGYALAQLLRADPVSATITAPQLAPLGDVTSAPAQTAASTAREGTTTELGPPVVAVVGLVARPGLVTLAPGARVSDALAAAGGAVPGADAEGLNLARQVADGEQIIVGAMPRPESPDSPRSVVIPPGQTVLGGEPPRPPQMGPGGAGPGPGTGPDASAGTRPGPTGGGVNVNTADANELQKLPGVGPATAAAIIAHRESRGPFGSVEQLLEVDGIGPAKLEKLRAQATV